MKTLFLIRHAKSDWGHVGTKDYDRCLNRRGQGDAPRMAKMMQQRLWLPDSWLCSSAQRAKETALLMCQTLDHPAKNICFDDALYLSSPETLLNHIATVDDSVKQLAVLAHNPGIGDLMYQLGTPHSATVPPCSIAVFALTIDHWFELAANTEVVTSIAYETPKTIG